MAPIGVAIALGGPLLGGAPALAQAEDPLVYEVKMSDDGKIAELKLVRIADGEVLAIGYPYGRPSLA